MQATWCTAFIYLAWHFSTVFATSLNLFALDKTMTVIHSLYITHYKTLLAQLTKVFLEKSETWDFGQKISGDAYKM